MSEEWSREELVERLQRREHHFLSAVEGEYDAMLLRRSRLLIAELEAECENLLDRLTEEGERD